MLQRKDSRQELNKEILSPRVIIVIETAVFMLGIFNQSEHSLMHGRTRRHVTGSVRGPDRPYVHVPVKNFGRQVHPGRTLRFHFHINEFYRISIVGIV